MVRDLHRRRGRERRGLALVEGVRQVEEALSAGLVIRGAVVSAALEGTPRGVALKAALQSTGTAMEQVTDAELDKLSATDHPQGVVVVAVPPSWRLEQVRLEPAATVLVLDGLQDPGNVGTVVRTALGLGAAGVLALPGTAEFTNPKALRASMGAFFRIPCVTVTSPRVTSWLAQGQVALWVGTMDGEVLAGRGEVGRLAIAVGNEGAGVSSDLLVRAHRRIRIPLAPGAESLNVAVAAGIMLWEVTRGG